MASMLQGIAGSVHTRVESAYSKRKDPTSWHPKGGPVDDADRIDKELMARRKAHYWTQSVSFRHEPGLPAIARHIYTMLVPSNHFRILTSLCHDFARYRQARCLHLFIQRLLLNPRRLRDHSLLLRIGASELCVVLNSISCPGNPILPGAMIAHVDCRDGIPSFRSSTLYNDQIVEYGSSSIQEG